MQTALRLAQRGFGKTWPNPTVGCVIVDTSELQKKVIGSGFTQPAGSDHAESVAIKQALNRYGKDKLFGATLYTSLEPCCHQGKTPPCTELIINNLTNILGEKMRSYLFTSESVSEGHPDKVCDRI